MMPQSIVYAMSQFLIGKVLQVERIASGNVENTFVSQFLIGKVELSNHY